MILAFILDYFFKDPNFKYHPIIIIGNIIKFFEKQLYQDQRKNGLILWLLVMLSTFTIIVIILYLTYQINFYCFGLCYVILSWLALGAGSLKKAALAVMKPLINNDLKQARIQLSYIVGRQTNQLDDQAIIKACVETISENTSDGVTAVLFYQAIGGVVFAYLYKAVNTMDSMLGYKNERYFNFGYYPAKLDDLFNYLPARISAYVMLIATWLLNYDYASAYQVFKSDRLKHSSPNAGWLESVSAGALKLQLGGPNYYHNQLVNKPYLGIYHGLITYDVILKSVKMMYLTFILFIVLISLIYLSIIYFI